MPTIDEIYQSIIDTVNNIGSFIGNLIDQINNALSSLVSSIASTISDIVGGIIDQVVSVFNSVANSIANVFDTVITTIGDFINNASNYISNLVDRAVEYISDLVSSSIDYLSDLYDSVTNYIGALFDDTVDLFSDVARAVVDSISAFVDSATIFLSDVFDTVAAGVSSIINQASDVVGALTQAIQDFITSVVDVIGNTLRDLLETIADLPGEISDLAQSLVDSAKENIGDPLAALPMKAIEAIAEAIQGEPVKEADKMQFDALALVFGRSPVIRSPETMREAINEFMPENAIVKTLIVTLLSPLILMQTMGGVANANSQIILQEHALVNPYRLIEPPDVIRAHHFDLIQTDQAIDELRKTGYTESAAHTLMEIGDFVPPPGELVAWWLRDFIDDKEFAFGLKKSGWKEQDIERLRKAAFFIPPVNDLITMAVREVFTPEIAERFGQFEDFPPQFVEQAAKQGVSEEWAKRYWGAHWALPSVQMGFEMLHRGFINQNDLSLLMRASDIMPFWRDKLIEISFSPLTRVDIRRMHKVGVLTEEEVNKSYHDIGYNDENAARLTEFTLALNADEPTENDVELSNLTRSNIIGFFSDGIILRDQAISLLLDAGIDPASAELFVLSAELDIERSERKDSITIIVNQAKSGSITFDEAQDKLNGLGLEELEKDKAISQLEKEESSRNKLPSKGDLDKMIGQNIIDEALYLSTMSLIGYNDVWAQRFLDLTKGGASDS